MPENNFNVILEVRNPIVRGDLEEVILSTRGLQLKNSGSQISCDLLILELGENLRKDFQLVQSILSSNMAKEVFLTSARLEPDLLLQALRAGAKEFLPQPINKAEAKEALLRFLQRMESLKPLKEAKRKGKIIDVLGSKGGVGTTTIAVNLGTSLKELYPNLSIAIIDMNLIFGEIPIFLNLETAFDWGEVAKNISRVDATYLMSILAKHSSGVYVLPSPTGLDGINVASPEIIEKLLNEMLEVFDFIIVDGGQSLDEISLKILEMADKVLLIAILSLPCLTNVKRLLWTFKKLGFPADEKIKIVINRYHKKSLITPKEAEESIQKEIFWYIPNDYFNTMSAINRGKTISAIAPKEEITKNFMELAKSFLKKQISSPLPNR